MRPPHLRTAPRACLLVLAAAIAACGAGPPSDAGQTPPASRASAPGVSASATAARESLAAPLELPAGFPVLPGAVPEEPPSDEAGVIARWSSDLVGSIAYDFYAEALPTAGYATVGLYPGGEAAIIRFQAPAAEVWQLVLTPGDAGGTLIEVRLDQP